MIPLKCREKQETYERVYNVYLSESYRVAFYLKEENWLLWIASFCGRDSNFVKRIVFENYPSLENEKKTTGKTIDFLQKTPKFHSKIIFIIVFC